jgi:hypothetical protein
MTISFIIFIGLCVILFLSFVHFDRLLKIEYEIYREQWVTDGKPFGIFWRPSESTIFLSLIAMWRLSLYWLFKTPEWIRNDVKAQKSLRKLRIFTLIWNVGIIVWFAITIITING